MRDHRREKEFSDYVRAQRGRIFVHWKRVSRADDPVAYGFKTLTNAFLDERRRAHRSREVLTEVRAEPTRTPGTTELRHVVLAAVGAFGYALAPRGDSSVNDEQNPSASVSDPATVTSPPPSAAPLALVNSTAKTAYFRFGVLPEGWQVWEEDGTYVQITEDGADGSDAHWLNDLVVMYDDQVTRTGERVQLQGRTFWMQHRANDRPLRRPRGDPSWRPRGGGIAVQSPQSAGFTDQQMLRLAASVEVLPGATASVG